MSQFSMIDHPGSQMDYRVVERFFVLGSEQSVFDTPAPDAREVPTPMLSYWLAHDGVRTVRDAAAFLNAGRGYQPDAAIYTLAQAIVAGPAATRAEALAVLPTAIKSSANLFLLLQYVGGRGRWSQDFREALGAWYTSRSTRELAYQVVFAPTDGDWTHQEAFKLARPTPPTDGHETFFRWLAGGKLSKNTAEEPGLELVAAAAQLQETSSPRVAMSILERWPNLRDALPAPWYRDPKIVPWIVSTLSGEGLVKWVRRLAKVDALGADLAGAVAIAQRLSNLSPTAKANLAPFAVLSAWAAVRLQVAQGNTPPAGLEATLYALFHERLAQAPQTSASVVIAIDPAASTAVDGLPASPGLDPRTALAALALLGVAGSERARVWAYGSGLELLDVKRGDDLLTLIHKLDQVQAGPVDGAAPIALTDGDDQTVSAFLILSGRRPAARSFAPEEALLRYQRAKGVPAQWMGVSLGQARLASWMPSSLDVLEIHGYDDAVPILLGERLGTPVR